MAVLTSNYPTSLNTTTTLGEVSNRAKTTLAVSLADTGETEISLTDASLFPNSGAITIDNEIFYYSSKATNVLTIESRARQSTTAASHSGGALVYLRLTKGHYEALRTSIISLETKLGVTSSTPASSTWLKGTGSGTSEWSAITKTDVGLSAVENTQLSTWAGTSNLTTLGTIATGVWQGTIVGSTYGGTGINNAGRTLTISTNSGTISFTTSVTLTVAATASVSGTNTGDQTSVTGNAGTATALQNARTIGGVSFDGTANITVASATGGFTISGGALALGANNITSTGSLGATGAGKLTKLWAVDVESTNMYTVNGTSLSSTFSAIAGSSSIVTVGTVSSGTWNGSVISSTYGGTGVNNGGRTLTLNTNSGTIAFGAASKTLTINNTLALTGTDGTTMTFPSTSATIATLGLTQTFTGINTFTPTARSSGVASYFTVTTPADTGQTAATESIGVNFTAATRTWADGTTTLQRERVFGAPTYNKTTTSATFTTAVNVDIADPVAGTGVTLTNKWALRTGATFITSSGIMQLSIGDNLGTLGASGKIVVKGNTSGNYYNVMGQGGSNNVQLNWIYNATAGNAYSELTTYAYSNSLRINASVVALQDANTSGTVTLGTTTASAKLSVVHTTEQLRVGYDASNYYKTTVSSSGGVTFDAVGSGGGFTFSDPISSTRINPRITTDTSSSTPTPAGDTSDMYTVTALAAAATFAAPTGTPVNGQKLLIRIKDNGTARTLAWNSIYRAIGVTLPTTTVISKTLYVGFVYNSADSKWDCISTGQES